MPVSSNLSADEVLTRTAIELSDNSFALKTIVSGVVLQIPGEIEISNDVGDPIPCNIVDSISLDVDFPLDYPDSASKSVLDNIKSKTDNLDAALSTLKTVLDNIKTKTDNLDTALSGIKTGTDKISNDQATQTTLALIKTKTDNLDAALSTLKTVLDNIKTKTDNLTSDPATQTTLALIKTKTDNLDAALSTLKTVLDNIKTKTDNLTSDPATQTTLALIKAKTDNLDTALSGIKSKTDNLDTALSGIKSKTDNLDTALSGIKTHTDYIPSDPAKESGKLTTIDSTLTAIKSTDGIKKITDTVTVSGTVTANAGTNLNTSALALEAGNLASVLTQAQSILSQLQGLLLVGSYVVGGSIDISSIAAGTNYIGKVKLTDGTYDAEVDPLGYLVNIPIGHHKVHAGEYFIVTDYDTSVDTASPKYWHIKAHTSKKSHLIIMINVDTAGLLQFFEISTLNADGTALTARNADRNNSATANTLFYYDPGVDVDGTTIEQYRIGVGGNQKLGGSTRQESEIILKLNTSYLIKYTPDGNGAKVTFQGEFYEV